MPTKKATKEETPSFIGKKIPKFKLPATGGQELTQDDLKNAVLYFYPKDNTSGCTMEGETFRDLHNKFKKQGVKVFGVSRDSIKSHEKFKEKHDFPFELISDEDEKLCNALSILKQKSLYGRKYIGIDRSTFVIDKDGKITHEWRNVKVPGHVEEVLETVSKK